MSLALSRLAWKVDGLRPMQRLALLYMADVARDPEHEFYEAHDKTAAALEISERSLSSCKKLLLKRGHITLLMHKRRAIKNGVLDTFKIHPQLPAGANRAADGRNSRLRRMQTEAPTDANGAAPILYPDEPLDNRQYNQLERLATLKISEATCDRIASEILSNRGTWCYDNGKVTPQHFPIRKSISTVLLPFVDSIPEPQLHSAWGEAVRRTNSAITDELAVADVGAYTIGCFRNILKEATGEPAAPMEK